MINRLADEQNNAAVGRRLLAQNLHRKANAVEDRSAAISGFEGGKGVCNFVEILCEAEAQLRFAVEVDDCNLMLNPADHCLDHGSECPVLVDLLRYGTADLH